MAIELQTDLLRKDVGSDSVVCDVLRHNVEQRSRLVTIVSLHDGKSTTQAIAYTLLAPHAWTEDIARIDQLLKRGSLMGETFRSEGYAIRQNRLLHLRLPVVRQDFARQFNCSWWNLACVEAYEFWADDSLYGIVLEIKNPHRRLVPQRPCMGLYAILRRTGYTTTHLMQLLDGTHSGSYRMWRLGLARFSGRVVGAWLYGKTMLVRGVQLRND